MKLAGLKPFLLPALCCVTLLIPNRAEGIERLPPVPPLSRVKRVYVEGMGGGKNSDQMRDMIIAAVQNSGLFVVTEAREGADATLRGSSDDKIYREVHNSGESIGLHANSGLGSSSSSARNGTTSSRQNGGIAITDNETSHVDEQRHEASASVRLVDEEGDVIWSTTQESGGGKFRGAMADVADKIVHQLSTDVHKARTEASRATPPR